MKRWNWFFVGGSLFVVGCTLDTAGLGPVSGTNSATGGGGQGGGGQGGGGQGGGGQGGSPECVTASDCPAPASLCAVASCNNGVCEEVPGNEGATCRSAVSNCDVDEICDGANASCAPDTGPGAGCQSNLPIIYENLDRTFTITSVNLAGTGQTLATVSPGAQVTLQVGGSWTRKSPPSCGSCITQFYVALEGTFQDCVDVSSANGMINRNITFTAPQSPGVYFINPNATWEYQCVAVTVPATFGQSTIATLVVQ